MSLRRGLLLTGSAFGAGAISALAGLRARRAERLGRSPEPSQAEAAQSVQAAAHTTAFVDALLARPAPGFGDAGAPVTAALYSRLTEDDISAIEATLSGSSAELWSGAHEVSRKRLALVFAANSHVTAALERTGLTADIPPEDVHAMARGPLAAGGDPYIADLVIGHLQTAGFSLESGATMLDFGCSSGRVLRAIAAARADLNCLGCDPNEGAIAWAQEHLRMAHFFVSPTDPPMDLVSGSVDAAYAISIWSHFDQPSALAWLEEMHRIVKPGGALLMTTHGLDTLTTFLRRDAMTEDSAATVVEALVSSGHHWFDVFGEDGDWGITSPGWGNAFLSMEWLLKHVTPAWSLRGFAPGGLDEVQDVIVLERRP